MSSSYIYVYLTSLRPPALLDLHIVVEVHPLPVVVCYLKNLLSIEPLRGLLLPYLPKEFFAFVELELYIQYIVDLLRSARAHICVVLAWPKKVGWDDILVELLKSLFELVDGFGALLHLVSVELVLLRKFFEEAMHAVGALELF